MGKKIGGVVGGFLFSTILGIVTFGIVHPIMSYYGFVLIGALLAGAITQDKGWFYGTSVGILNVAFTMFTLIMIGPSLSKSIALLFSSLCLSDLLTYFLIIICGTLGGYIGEILQKHGQGKHETS